MARGLRFAPRITALGHPLDRLTRRELLALIAAQEAALADLLRALQRQAAQSKGAVRQSRGKRRNCRGVRRLSH